MKSLVVLDRDAQQPDLVHVLPDEQATLVFTGGRVGPRGTLEGAQAGLMLHGPPTRAYARVVDVPVSIVVTFQAAGGYLLLGAPMAELADAGVDLRDCLGEKAERLKRLLCEADSHETRLDGLERFLIERVEECSGRQLRASQVVDLALGALRRRCDEAVEEPQQAAIAPGPASPRQLRRLFKAVLGLNPHELLRIERFHRALGLARAAPSPCWAHIAAACGYFDQSHLIADFRAFASAPPARLMKLLRSGLPHLQGSWFAQ